LHATHLGFVSAIGRPGWNLSFWNLLAKLFVTFIARTYTTIVYCKITFLSLLYTEFAMKMHPHSSEGDVKKAIAAKLNITQKITKSKKD